MIKNEALSDKILNEHISKELRKFSQGLLNFIQRAGNPNTLSQAEAKEKERSRQYIEKLIEYIGKSGQHQENNETRKYLILSFIQVMEIAGEDKLTPKERRHAKKFVLVIINKSIDHIG